MLTVEKSAPRARKGQWAFVLVARRAFTFDGAMMLTATASLAVGTAFAQENAPSDDIEEVMVTGTRIVRDGYEAPTPVTVLGEERLEAMAVTNIATAVNRLPVFGGSITPQNVPSTISSGIAGVNHLDLRGLGPNRTLVLLDGKRVVGSTLIGPNDGSAVDINAFPDGLIERVDVVTGGASAVYGSDALAGIVNFVLDTDYTGIKSAFQGGVTTHGDGENYRASLTAGTPFAEDRAHFLFNAERAYQSEIRGKPRDWADNSRRLLTNPDYTPTNGQPQLLAVSDVGLSVATRGGLIVSCPSAPGTTCPLRGTQFLEGGTPAPFEFGPLISGILMSGGDWKLSQSARDSGLALELIRDTVFSRVSYDVSDSATAFVSLHLSRSRADNNQAPPNFKLGNITILSGNPFIPDSVQAEMTALGIPSFTMGTLNADLPNLQAESERTFARYVVGVEGAFDAVDTDWLWDAYYSRSTNDIVVESPGANIIPYYARAVDAVVQDGHIVCGVNADADPANDVPACYPFNPMGIGVNTQLAIDYVTGLPHGETYLEQDVIAVDVTGEPFSSWAGPVSMAFGAAHRREEVSGWATALDEQSIFLAGNYHASFGKYHVTEGFIETVVPLANGQPLAESLDLNAAVRWTDYSTSGEVVTWKLGASWAPLEDVRFRLTRSRDIRAPNLGDLFNAGRTSRAPAFDPFTDMSYVFTTIEKGNVNLEPEEADTTGVGVIFTPSFLSGFAASVDYYDIKIEAAIASLDKESILRRCFQGATLVCSFIHRDADGFVDLIDVVPANILSQSTTGIDVELSYTFPLSNISSSLDGELRFRALGTYLDSLTTADFQGVIEGAGVNADDMGTGAGNALYAPDFQYLLSTTYDNYPLSATVTMRGIGSGVYNNAFIECASDCPAASPAHPTINDNHIDGITYVDLAVSYTFYEDHAEAFFVVDNALDKDPPPIAGDGFLNGQGNSTFYDRLGRMVRAGVRLNF